MRPFHLGLLACLLAAVLTGLWFLLSGPLGSVRAANGANGGRDATDTSAAELAAGTDADADLAAKASARTALQGALSADQPAPEKPKKRAKPTVLGRVLSASGEPLEGARVLAAGGNNWAQIPLDIEPEAMPKGWLEVQETKTDAAGCFLFEDLKSGGLRLCVRAAGHAPLSEEHLDLPRDYDEYTLADLKLVRGVTLKGSVVERSGKAVPGAQILGALDGRSGAGSSVSVPGRGVPLAKSADDGSFTIDTLAVGPWHLIVDAVGYQVLEEEGRTDHPGDLRAGLVLRLEPGADICGKVILGDGAKGELQSGLRVSARPSPEKKPGEQGGNDEGFSPDRIRDANAGEQSSTGDARRPKHTSLDADGAFCIHGLKPGMRYKIGLSQPGPKPDTWKPASGFEPATAWAGERGVSLVWKPESALCFRVLDAKSGAPLEELLVWAGIGRERSLRDEGKTSGEPQRHFSDGRVRFGDLRPGTTGKPVILRVHAAGYKEYENKNIALAPALELDLGEIRLELEHKVAVRVVDGVDGKPVADARVLMSSKSTNDLANYLDTPPEYDWGGDLGLASARTGPDGWASLTSEPGKSVVLRADAKGLLPNEPEHKLLPRDADATFELRLQHGGSVTVLVRDSLQQPVAGVGIAHRKPATKTDDNEGWVVDAAELRTDLKGEAHFAALAKGIHGFRMHDQKSARWHEADQDNSLEGWVETTVIEGSSTTLEFQGPPRGSIHGRIREAGRPLEGASLKLTEHHDGEKREWNGGWVAPNDPLSTLTDHEGNYAFVSLRCGSYDMSIYHESRRMPVKVQVEITAVPRGFDFELDVAGIEGRVTDVEGKPLAGIQVTAWVVNEEGWDAAPYQMVVSEDDRGQTRVNYQQKAHPTERTDENGRYLLRGLRTNHALMVNVEGEMVESVSSGEITLQPDELRRSVDFKLRLAGSIDVALAGEFPPNQNEWFEVRAILVENDKESVRQSSWLGPWNKRELMRSLSPGHYKLVLALQGENGPLPGGQTQEVDVREAETAHVQFQVH